MDAAAVELAGLRRSLAEAVDEQLGLRMAVAGTHRWPRDRKYRTISFWLATLPGAIAYLRLRRQLDHAGDARD